MSEKRLFTIDSLRGFSLISMILFHFCWDLKYIAGLSMEWYTGFPAYIWQQSICWVFIFISGFSFVLSGKPLKNGILISVCGGAVTFVTLLFMPEDRVIFGVLTLIGASILLTFILKDVLSRPDPRISAVITAFFFVITKSINGGCLGILDIPLIRLPSVLYRGLFLTFLGFMDPSFFSTDYFSLIPWYLLFLCGFFTGRFFRESFTEYPGFLRKIRLPVLASVGRHSLIIYMLHQPVLYLLVMMIMRGIG